MVTRSEHLAALSEAEATSQELQSIAREKEWLKQQLSQAREHLEVSRASELQLQEKMKEMAAKTDLLTAQLRLAQEQEEEKAEKQKLLDTIKSLRDENDRASRTLQVRQILVILLNEGG